MAWTSKANRTTRPVCRVLARAMTWGSAHRTTGRMIASVETTTATREPRLQAAACHLAHHRVVHEIRALAVGIVVVAVEAEAITSTIDSQ
jgi:hypothetical protein